MGFEGKKVLVCGMARSGVAAAQCLYECGAKVTICDNKSEQQLSEALAPLAGMDIRRCLGGEQPDFPAYDLVVTSPGIPLTAPVLKNAAAAGVPIIGELEAGAQVSRAPLYAITGTNGKTTTTTLVGEIFKNYGKTAYVVGNIGYPFTACALNAGPEDVAVAEVSSFQLETTTTFHPHVAVMCNITEDHLNRHGTMEEYIRIKERIFEKMDENDFAVLNYDDEIVRGMAVRLHCRAAFFSHRAEVQLGTYVEDGEMIFIKDGKKKRIIKVDEIYIPGEHNLEHALAAAALTLLAGVHVHVVRHTLKTFKGVEHRIETVRTVDGVTYLNAEQYLMHQKALCCGDAATAAQVMENPDPKTVKLLGRAITPYDDEAWRAVRQEVIYRGLLAKFGQNSGLKHQLLATGDAIIAECSPNDRIWGIGLALDDPRHQDVAQWQGESILGRALMRVRDTLRNEEA